MFVSDVGANRLIPREQECLVLCNIFNSKCCVQSSTGWRSGMAMMKIFSLLQLWHCLDTRRSVCLIVQAQPLLLYLVLYKHQSPSILQHTRVILTQQVALSLGQCFHLNLLQQSEVG